MISSIDSPAWSMSWSVSKLTCSSLLQRWKPELLRTLPGRFPSFFLTYLILLRLGWLIAWPGGNVTGFTTISTVLAGKRLELLKETVPNLSRVAVLWDPQNPASAQQWKESQLPAREMGLQLHSMEVSSFDKFESAFKEAVKARSAAIAVTQNTLVASNQTRVVELTAKNRLPAMYTNGTYVANGALMSYGPDQAESFRRAASIVDKILKGTKPADIPVEQPTKFEFVINLKAAKQIGLTIPPNVLVRADRVIK
jgi:putative tryptophan/tyrosine transport system substrate-binding protein